VPAAARAYSFTVGTNAEVASQTRENRVPAVDPLAEVTPKADADVADTVEPGAVTASSAPKPDQSGTGNVVAVEEIRLSPSTLETVSRCALLASASLYGVGLVIANFNAQLYGRYNLGFVEAQYVLVGLLWLFLTLLAFALTESASRWMKSRGPWRGRPLKQDVKKGLLVAFGWLTLWSFYVIVMGFLGVAFGFEKCLAVLVVLILQTLSLGALFQETWQDMKSRGQPSDSFLLKLRKVDPAQIARRVLFFFAALSLYAAFVYPQLSAAVGGGRLHQADIMIRQDRRSLFDGMAEFKIDKAGKLGPVSIVAESDQSLIVTATDKPWTLTDMHWWDVYGLYSLTATHGSRRRSLLLKKDLIELVIYTK
jgi:hypothetical protein